MLKVNEVVELGLSLGKLPSLLFFKLGMQTHCPRRTYAMMVTRSHF